MMNAPDSPEDRPLNELPHAYRAAVEAILAEPTPEIDLERLIPSELSPRTSTRAISSQSLGAILMSPRNLITLGVAIALIVLISQLIPSSNGDFALAQVQQQVEKLHSIQYKETFQVPGSPQPQTRRCMNLGDSKARWEDTANSDLGRSVTTFDPKQMLTIFPEKKAYFLLVYIDPPGDGKDKRVDKKLTWRDTFDELLRKPSDSVKRLPEKEVDGKMAVGFVTEHEEKTDQFVGTIRNTYWIDKKTKLPVRIELTTHSTNPGVKDREVDLLSDFVFDAPLDPALFSTEPPKGYKNLQPQVTPPPDKPSSGHFELGRIVPAPVKSKPENPSK
jgi:outer membrane lipoprotein-sorting protein